MSETIESMEARIKAWDVERAIPDCENAILKYAELLSDYTSTTSLTDLIQPLDQDEFCQDIKGTESGCKYTGRLSSSCKKLLRALDSRMNPPRRSIGYKSIITTSPFSSKVQRLSSSIFLSSLWNHSAGMIYSLT